MYSSTLSDNSSYLFKLVFFMKLVELSGSQVGVIILTELMSEAFFSVVNGYLGDKVNVPIVSRKFGRRKLWNLLATIIMAFSIPLLLNRCLLCNGRDQSRLPLVYYCTLAALKGVSFKMVEINHLAFVITLAENLEDATALSAMRFVLNTFPL